MGFSGLNRRQLFIGVVGIALVAAGAAGTFYALRTPKRQPLTLWYGDQQAMFLAPVASDADLPAPETGTPFAGAILDRLRHAPEPALAAFVTPAVSLREARFTAPRWEVSLRVDGSFGSSLERLMIGSLVRSLLSSTPGAESVSLRLEDPSGKPYAGQHLDLGRPLSAADFENRLESDTTGLPMTVWWRLPASERLVPVRVALAAGSGSPAHDAFERLVTGPPAEMAPFLAPVAPGGPKPKWSGLTGTTAEVAVPDTVTGTPDGVRFVKAAALTLTEVAGVSDVRFTPGGHVGPFDLDLPVARPAAIAEALRVAGTRP